MNALQSSFSKARSLQSEKQNAHIDGSGPFNRRGFLKSVSAVAASAVAAPVLGRAERDWSGNTPVRYPNPDIIVMDPRFAKYKLGNTPTQRLHVGSLWAEGPAWNGVGRYLVWSDIPSDCQYRWIADDGHVSVMRRPSGNSNGNTFDYQGRQLSCQHGPRKVVRYEYDGTETVIAEKFEGESFNAPNDVVVHPNGDIWFTDPGYGGLMNYEGNRLNTGSVQPVRKEAVYRVDGQTGKISKVTDEIGKPNGLCFSPDYRKLYIAETGSTHYPDVPKEIKVWDVVEQTRLVRGRRFASMEMELNGETVAGLADGIRADEDGNIWSSAGWVGDGYDGVHIFAPDGDRIGQIVLPEICSNLCFGGAKRNRLFMTGSQSLYALYVETKGAHIA